MSRKPGGQCHDQMLSEYWGAGSKAQGVRNGLQGVIHCREKPKERDERAGGWRRGGEVGGGWGGQWR